MEGEIGWKEGGLNGGREILNVRSEVMSGRRLGIVG
jgi:hypothetical protein